MKTVILLLTLCLSLAASEAQMTRYKVVLSLFGTVGEARITIAEQGDEYIMILEDYATGLAAKISGNELDRFVSRGHIREGRYVSDTFEEYQTNDTTVESNVFIFDHEAKTVTRYQDKNETVTENTFNAFKMCFEEKTRQKIIRKTKVLEYYSEYDALSVVLNLPQLLFGVSEREIKPVGLAKEERRMVIRRPPPEALPELLEAFHSPNVTRVFQLDSQELEDEDEYGVLIGYNDRGGIEEVVTKETYFVIGYGRIEKLDAVRLPADTFFE